MSTELKKGDTFHIGQVCQESGVYRLKGCSCTSEEQREIPLAQGNKFPPCKSCCCPIAWEFMRKA